MEVLKHIIMIFIKLCQINMMKIIIISTKNIFNIVLPKNYSRKWNMEEVPKMGSYNTIRFQKMRLQINSVFIDSFLKF